MILAFDTYYYDDKAKTVCIAFEKWEDNKPFKIFSETVTNVEDYEPGAFYKREFPCIMSLLQQIELENIEAIVIDGFVVLDDNNKPGLGAYLYENLDKKIPVIGVAKTNFASIENNKKLLLRGQSNNPLYITAMGIILDQAAANIQKMQGAFRIPDLLKQLDGLTKQKPL